MPRLTAKQWEQARAEYEIGRGVNELARKYGVSKAAVSKKVNSEHWEQGKSKHIVERKVAVIKALKEVNAESEQLPEVNRKVIEAEVASQVEFDQSMLRLGNKIALKTAAMLDAAAELGEAETASRVFRNLKGNEARGTTVNVQQQQAQGQHLSPSEVVDQILAED